MQLSSFADENTNGVWSWSYLGGTGSPSSAWGDTGDTLWIEAATEQYGVYGHRYSLLQPIWKSRDARSFCVTSMQGEGGSLGRIDSVLLTLILHVGYST